MHGARAVNGARREAVGKPLHGGAACRLACSAVLLAAFAANARADEHDDDGGRRDEDDGRVSSTKSYFYANGGGGVSYVGLTTLNSSDLALGNAGGAGPAVDLGLGLRLVILTLGPRARYTVLPNFDMWQLNGEVALHIPVGRWDGFAGLHAGYSFVGNFSRSAFSDASSPTPSEDLRVRGWNAGLDLGLDYYLTRSFSIGGAGMGEVLFVRRPALATTNDPQFGVAGGGVGLAASLALRAGLHL
ncbi:MAG: hypothetical protein IPG50_37270 [Myxococcales bacterium]|nr:hypothetical protein [Myxococcales bacterium]